MSQMCSTVLLYDVRFKHLSSRVFWKVVDPMDMFWILGLYQSVVQTGQILAEWVTLEWNFTGW